MTIARCAWRGSFSANDGGLWFGLAAAVLVARTIVLTIRYTQIPLVGSHLQDHRARAERTIFATAKLACPARHVELDQHLHTLQGVDMATMAVPQPTLWRTCRVLANRSRLRLLGLLFEQPHACVSEVARRSGLASTVVTQYLRAMNARGLLQAERTGRWVYYRPGAESSSTPARRLLAALRQSFCQNGNPVETIYKAATAFTHPRRIEIWRALLGGARTLEQLRPMTRISRPALIRHLRKLQARGFVSVTAGNYRPARPRWPAAQALTELAFSSGRARPSVHSLQGVDTSSSSSLHC